MTAGSILLRISAPIIVSVTVCWASMLGSVSAEVILLDGSDAGLTAAKVHLGGRLIGLVGDYLDLPTGVQTLSVKGPDGWDRTLVLSIESGEATVRETQPESHICHNGEGWDRVSWAPTTTKPDTVNPAITSVVIGRLDYRRMNRGASCRLAAPISLGCNQRHIDILVESDPKGAEIWVGDERISAQTDATVSVTYCTYEKTKTIMVRISEYVTCVQDISTSEGPSASVDCTLSRPGH